MSQINHVVRVEHNLKGGGEVILGQHTLIVGPNGSGKSAIVNAIELALTGKASDIAGRDVVAQGAALASLANGSGAWSEVQLDDGSTARWEIGRSGRKVSRAKRSGREGVMPLRQVLGELTGSAEKARKFLLQHACEGLDNSHITGKLDQDTLSRYQRLTDVRLAPIDNLLAVAALAGKKEREAKKHAAGAKEAEEAAAAGLGPAPTESALEEALEVRKAATAAQYEAQDRLRQARASATTTMPRGERFLKIKGLTEWIQQAEKEVRELREKIQSLPTDEKAGYRQTLMEVVNLMETVWTDGPCLACGQDFDRVRWVDHANHIRAAVQAGVEKNRVRDGERDQAQARVVELLRVSKKAQSKIAELQAIADAPEGIDVDEATLACESAALDLHRAEEAYTKLREVAACWERVHRAKAVRREAEREAIGWGVLDQQCKSLVAELVEDAVDTFANRVQRFLPESERFAIKFDKSAVRYGLMRDGEIHTALSGAEWARVSTALAAACTPAEAAVPLLVPEDRAWDPKTLRSALQGLTEYRGQVIVATTVKPFRGVPAGWTLIEVGA